MEEEILNLVNVCVNKGKFSLKDISFKIEEGYLMGIIGKNGAGKTTLLNTIIGKMENILAEYCIRERI